MWGGIKMDKMQSTDTLLRLSDNNYQLPNYYRLKGIMYSVQPNEAFKLAFNNQYTLQYEDINGATAERYISLQNQGTSQMNGFIPYDLYINQIYFGTTNGDPECVTLIIDFADTLSR